MEYKAMKMNKPPPQAPAWIRVMIKFRVVNSKFRLVLFIFKREGLGCNGTGAESQFPNH